MTVYSITTPEQLKVAADLMKNPDHVRKVRAVAAVWNGYIRRHPDKPTPMKITMEVGRSAVLFKECNGEREPLGPMYVIGAREFAKELQEA